MFPEESTVKRPWTGSAPELGDVLPQEVLDEVDRKFVQSEVRVQELLGEESARVEALTVDELRELARRAGRGEEVSIKSR